MNKLRPPSSKRKVIHGESKAFHAARKYNVMMILLKQYRITEEDLKYMDTLDIRALYRFYRADIALLRQTAAARGIKL